MIFTIFDKNIRKNIFISIYYKYMIESSYDFLYKVIVIGDSGVGKSNLLMQFIQKEIIEEIKPTIGVDFYTRNVNIDNDIVVKLQIWDTAGQERYRAMTSTYYRGAVGVLIMYDITKYKTFENVNKWLLEIKKHAEENIKIIIVGNKTDDSTSREVPIDTVKKFAEEKSIAFIEISVREKTNIELVFQILAKEIYKISKQSDFYDKDENNIIEIPKSINAEPKTIKICKC